MKTNDCQRSFGICRALLAAVCVASIIGKTWAENNPVPQVFWHMEVEVDGVGKPISIESEEQAFEKSQGTFSFGPLKAGERVFYISVTLNVKETPVGKVYTGSVANNEKGTRQVGRRPVVQPQTAGRSALPSPAVDSPRRAVGNARNGLREGFGRLA